MKIKKKSSFKIFNDKVLSYIFLLLILLAVGIIFNDLNKYIDATTDTKNTEKVKEINISDIVNAYSEKIITLRNANLYIYENDSYMEIGHVIAASSFFLDLIEPTINDIYFKIKNTEYYVKYSDIMPVEDIVIDEHYKNYIPLNKNVTTDDKFVLYLNGKEYLSINESRTMPVIMLGNDEYFIEFNEQLMSIKSEDIVEETNANNTTKVEATNIAVLNYHFFYDASKEVCNEPICLEKKAFESQLKYLKDNGFYTLTMNDFNLWMDKKIRLPKKSVLITIDDGAMGTDTHLIELLEKYDMNATLFLITAWWKKSKYESPNLEVHSHGYDIHIAGTCGKAYKALCMSKEALIADFNKSKELVEDTTAFCYPFYAYNNTIIEALKETGFKLGFIGGDKKANQSNDKYKIPRYVIYKWHQASDIMKMVN